MWIPPAINRDAFYHGLCEDCLVSRGDRVAEYERLRTYYLWGCSPAGNPATFNKILPQIDLLTSFLFAAETTKFDIVVGENDEKQHELHKVPALTKRLNGRWQDSNADVQYGQAVIWALVYNTMMFKMVQRGKRTLPYLVEPHSFGVLREDMPFLDDQEAFVHTYNISLRALDRMLDDHPKKSIILSSVSSAVKQPSHDIPASVQRIIMSNQGMAGYPNGPGQLVSPGEMANSYRAKLADESVELRELWVWDDALEDYRVVTMASGGICIYDRKNFYLPGEHPFVQVCPNPSYDYFWGHSEVARVTALQDARENRMQQIADLLDRQVKPPVALQGNWQGIQDEMQYALNVFGAGISTNDPMAKVQDFKPTVPNDVFVEVREYDTMFNEMMGLSNVVQGKGESGVRSKGQTDTLARLGSARIKKRAFTLEDGLDKIGTHYLRLIQQHDPEPMLDDKGQKFIAEQFTQDFCVKVDGHSSSPIFSEDKRQLMFSLFEAHAIDRATLIDGVDAPGKQVLLERLKDIEAGEAKARQAQQQAEAAREGMRRVK